MSAPCAGWGFVNFVCKWIAVIAPQVLHMYLCCCCYFVHVKSEGFLQGTVELFYHDPFLAVVSGPTEKHLLKLWRKHKNTNTYWTSDWQLQTKGKDTKPSFSANAQFSGIAVNSVSVLVHSRSSPSPDCVVKCLLCCVVHHRQCTRCPSLHLGLAPSCGLICAMLQTIWPWMSC